MSRSTLYGVADPDQRCALCLARSGGATFCSQKCADEDARLATEARAFLDAGGVVRIGASSAPPIASDTPTRAPGTFAPATNDLMDLVWDGDDQ